MSSSDPREREIGNQNAVQTLSKCSGNFNLSSRHDRLVAVKYRVKYCHVRLATHNI